MKRFLLACLVLLLCVPAFAGMRQIDPDAIDFDGIRDRVRAAGTSKGTPLPSGPPGFSMEVDLVSQVSLGIITFQIRWSGPGWYSIYGGCPSGQCAGPNYIVTDMVLPPAGIGILTHSGINAPTGFPTSTYPTPGGNLTTFTTTVATSQPNNLHGFLVSRLSEVYTTAPIPTYPVFFSTSIPGTPVAGPGREYVATVDVPIDQGGIYFGSALQRLLHYTTTTTIPPQGGSPVRYLTVGGTPDQNPTTTYQYLFDYEYFEVAVTIPTTNSYGLVALGMILAGAGLLVVRRRRPPVLPAA